MVREALSRLGAQDGYTVVEMIVTMALTAALSGAIFSSFLVLDRVQTAWEQRDQARAVGVIAEQLLQRDVQAYNVYRTTPNLVLRGISSQPASQPAPFEVTYSITKSSGTSLLVRTVTQGSTTLTSGTVAHGVRSLTASCVGTPGTLRVGISLDAISNRANPQPVSVNPELQLRPRNGVCPP